MAHQDKGHPQRPGVGQMGDGLLDQRAQPCLQAIVGPLLRAEAVDDAAEAVSLAGERYLSSRIKVTRRRGSHLRLRLSQASLQL